MLTLILASQSPRRRDLLEKAGFQFHTHSMEISEIISENITLDDALMMLARQKAEAILASGKLAKYEDFLIVSADTVVVVDQEVIGKPTDVEDAVSKIRLLSGRSHLVKTALFLMEVSGSRQKSSRSDAKVETSEVTFRKLSENEIRNYVEKFRPLDKAGAYGVQDLPIGTSEGLILEVKGNLDNVMGLPVKMLEELLNKNAWKVARRKL